MCIQFQQNINEDNSSLHFLKEELEGVKDLDIYKKFEKDGQ